MNLIASSKKSIQSPLFLGALLCFALHPHVLGQDSSAQGASVEQAAFVAQGLKVFLLSAGGPVTGGQRTDAPLMVRVTDQNDRPVEGANVVFRLPITTRDAVSFGGKNSVAVRTDGLGQASVSDLTKDARADAVAVHVTATYGNQFGETTFSLPDVVRTAVNAKARQPSTPRDSQIKLPVEVIGLDGTTAAVSLNVVQAPDLNGPLTFYMQIHGLRYPEQASVQVNNSGWRPINGTTVTLLGLANAYGGIGGGFHTLRMTMSLPPGLVNAGTNTVTFRFNQTDGRVSGFRVLALDIWTRSGNSVISPGTFVQDDPNTWKPPSTNPSDIAAGRSLWRTAALTVPTPAGSAPIRARCMDCHSEDGRDLKYFNYSNKSIRARSMFHGLTAQQGDEIASYVRTLDVPNPGRPWNPPYQPGPGLDSQPVSNWAAGAGLSAVLNSDAEMQPYILPGGSSAKWAANAYLNPREIPIPLQLEDWNSWLPQIHPMDAFGASFADGALNAEYHSLRKILQPNSAAAYRNALPHFNDWWVDEQKLLVPVESNANWDANDLRRKVYSTAQWMLVKQWELNQEFGLEAMPQVAFGSKADVRGWIGNQSFNTSPVMLHIPTGTGLGNGSLTAHEYLALIWYQTQLVLNDGQGGETDNNPIDFPYVLGSIKDLSANTGHTPAANNELMWLVKALQEETQKGYGPQYGIIKGFVPTTPSPVSLAYGSWDTDWSGTPRSTRAALTEAYLRAWFAQVSSYRPIDYYGGVNGGGGAWASATQDPKTMDYLNTFGGQTWFMLPRMRWLGVDPNLVDRISTWAATVWPAGDWAANNAATCASLGHCTSDR